MFLAAALSCLGGCDSVLTVPKTHMTQEYTPQTYEFKSDPAIVWNALVAEMAAETGQTPIAQDADDRMGSWAATMKRTKWIEVASESIPDHFWIPREGQGLTTGWVDVGPSGRGSNLYLSRVYMCDSLYQLTVPSRGDFERSVVARMRKRLGESQAASPVTEKAAHP